MCGIAGKIDLCGPISGEELWKAAASIKHRGPDDSGIWISDDATIGLAHTRLSLVDLSPGGHQPMSSEGGRFQIVYNGEIYNYRKLRLELEEKGLQFKGCSDTEVILQGYAYWGKSILSKLKGMFAFALYDSKEQHLLLARDRFGIKPLFYAFQGNKLFFGSEVKAIRSMNGFQSVIRPRSVSTFLANRYVSEGCCLWEDIRKLEAAHCLEVNAKNLTSRKEMYWHLPLHTDPSVDLHEGEEIFARLLTASLSEHLLADVPVGAFLSGGYDSSALVALMANLTPKTPDTFSIGFKGWTESEDKYAEMVAKHTGANLHKLILERIDLEVLPTLMYHYDDPIADISILPTFAVSRLASSKVKAVVSGEGADELLGGYWWQKPENFFFAKPWRRWACKVTGVSKADIKAHYIEAMSMGHYDANELRRALVGIFQEAVPDDPFSHYDQLMSPELTTRKQIQFLDIKTFMGELVLTKVDRASMAHGLEVRVPFLDHELVEKLFAMPESIHFQKGLQKPLLSAFLRDKVPPRILQRPKQGFVGPDDFYKDIALYSETLSKGRLVREGVVNPAYVAELLQKKTHWKLWKLFVLEHWWRVWV
jgi:asparagine synthase (glutamine-hydrolysing)